MTLAEIEAARGDASQSQKQRGGANHVNDAVGGAARIDELHAKGPRYERGPQVPERVND